MKLADIKAGDTVVTDGVCFTCMKSRTSKVYEDDEGLYIKCCEGHHYLDGQEDETGELIGLSKPVIRDAQIYPGKPNEWNWSYMIGRRIFISGGHKSAEEARDELTAHLAELDFKVPVIEEVRISRVRHAAP